MVPLAFDPVAGHFDGEEADGRLRELAEEVPAGFDGVDFSHLQELRVDAGAVRYSGEDLVPARVSAFPDVVEKASRAARRSKIGGWPMRPGPVRNGWRSKIWRGFRGQSWVSAWFCDPPPAFAEAYGHGVGPSNRVRAEWSGWAKSGESPRARGWAAFIPKSAAMKSARLPLPSALRFGNRSASCLRGANGEDFSRGISGVKLPEQP